MITSLTQPQLRELDQNCSANIFNFKERPQKSTPPVPAVYEADSLNSTMLTNKPISKRSSTALTNWNKIRVLYRFLVKLKHPEYTKINRIESLQDDINQFIDNKTQHISRFGQLPAYKSLDHFAAEMDVEDQTAEFHRLLRVTKQNDIFNRLFEYAANGSDHAIEEMTHLIQQDIS